MHARAAREDGRAQPALMVGGEEGEDERDGDRIVPAIGNDSGDPRRLRVTQFAHHAAVGAHTLVDLDAGPARHQGRALLDIEVEQVMAPQALDLDHVARPERGDEGGVGALQFQDRVGGDGGAEDEAPDILGLDTVAVAQALEPGDDRARRVRGHGGHLEGDDIPAPGIERHEVGEGAAGIDAEIVHLWAFGYGAVSRSRALRRLAAVAGLHGGERHADAGLGRLDHGQAERVLKRVAVARHAGTAMTTTSAPRSSRSRVPTSVMRAITFSPCANSTTPMLMGMLPAKRDSMPWARAMRP